MSPIYSVGHSELKLKDFLALIKDKDIDVIVDIRRFPDSEVYSSYCREELKEILDREGIKYLWKGDALGGYREETLEERSPNDGWDVTGFKTYADHALSDEFQQELEELIEMSNSKNIAIMCAESIYWRCYRRILCDWLLTKGKKVVHLRKGEEKEHEITARAVVKEGKVTYPKD